MELQPHKKYIGRARHTPRCIVTVQILIKVQNQLQPLYSVHNEFENIIINSVKSLKLLMQVGSLPHLKDLCTQFILEKQFSINIVIHMSRVTQNIKILGLKNYCTASIPYIKGFYQFYATLLTTYAQKNMEYGHVQHSKSKIIKSQ